MFMNHLAYKLPAVWYDLRKQGKLEMYHVSTPVPDSPHLTNPVAVVGPWAILNAAHLETFSDIVSIPELKKVIFMRWAMVRYDGS